jgi:NTE family protein
MTDSPSEQQRALVLGGGGITGIAWELGLLAGLAEAGVDLTSADLVVGTSAGSVVGAQITSGAALEDLYGRQLEPPSREKPARMGVWTIAQFLLAWLVSRGDDDAFLRGVGRIAMRASTPAEAQRLAVIENRLPRKEWPERPLRVTTIDAQSGEFKVLDRNSGIDLVQAVASSCAVPGVFPPVTLGMRRYMDGGMRSPANVDLAAGYRRVVVLAPIAQAFGKRTSPASQLAALGAERTALVVPDAASKAAIGRNVLDPAARAPSARAGRAQARNEVERVRASWAE